MLATILEIEEFNWEGTNYTLIENGKSYKTVGVTIKQPLDYEYEMIHEGKKHKFNYHTIKGVKKVMQDKEGYYIDYRNTNLKHLGKIYIEKGVE